MKNFKAKLFGVSAFVLALAVSCNRDFDKVVPGSPGLVTNVTFKKPKVLYIIVDGARGTSVRDADINNMRALIPSSIYTWNSLADANGTNAANWADMITGVKKEKHNVLTEDFAGNQLGTYKTIFDRIKSVKTTTRIAAFSTSAAFNTNLTAGADAKQQFNSDVELKNHLVNFVKADTASLIVAEFSGVDAAGKTVAVDGYDNVKNPAYKAAINTFDAQVGEVLTAVKGRATYANENWLLIITSNKGGSYTLPPAQDDKTVFSNANINTFTIISNLAFTQTFINKPFVGNSYSGSAPRFLGDPEKAIATTPEDPELNKYFNFGFDSTANFTISVKIKKRKNPSNISRGDYYYQWPSFMGRRRDVNASWGSSGNAGWDFCLIQNTWRFFIGGGSGGAFPNGYEFKGLDFSGDSWHDLTAVIEKKVDGAKYVRIYTDGVRGISNWNGGSLANPFTGDFKLDGTFNPNVAPSGRRPLRVGYVTGEIDGSLGKIDVDLKELKIFNVAIPEETVKQYACDQTINRAHPYYDNLLGYWPMDEGSGNKLIDKSPLGQDMTLSGGYSWGTFTSLVCSPPAANLGLLVPKNSDIPAQILSWFNISRQSAWALDGKVWIPN